jgi:alpha-tubulin suppressor-like RCC1 family protein
LLSGAVATPAQGAVGSPVVWGWGANAGAQVGAGLQPLNTVVRDQLPSSRRIDAGSEHALAVAADGTGRAWGANQSGQLGDNTRIRKPAPVQMERLTDIVDVAAGSGSLGSNGFSLALLGDGTVWAAGENEFGQLGDGTTTDHAKPNPVVGLSGMVGISAGMGFGAAVGADGVAWAWGYNVDGQLGDGTTHGRLTPVPVSELTGVVQVAAGEDHVVALRDDGTVWTWGSNQFGQLGDGTAAGHRTVPDVVPGLDGVVAVSAGARHSMALRSDGTVWGWGDNDEGQLGDGSVHSRVAPVAAKNLTRVVAIDGGGQSSLALDGDGRAWAWGAAAGATLGDVATAAKPAVVHGLDDAEEVAAGDTFFLVRVADGRVWSWGSNSSGQLGIGFFGEPTQISPSPAALGGRPAVIDVDGGGAHAVAVLADGSVSTWGRNDRGQLGNGTVFTGVRPARVAGVTGAVAASAGNLHTLVATADGRVLAWGANESGQLGDGTTTDHATPIDVPAFGGGGARATAVAAGASVSYALTDDGGVWRWGAGASAIPTPVVGLPPVVAIATFCCHALALTGDGTVYAWGFNGSGQLGDGTRISRADPQPVAGLPPISSVSAGLYHSLAIANDGRVWAWGENNVGELGDGSRDNDRLTPVRVTVIDDVVSVAAGSGASYAATADGTAWAWGSAQGGRLGLGTGPPLIVKRPTVIPGLSSVLDVAAGGLGQDSGFSESFAFAIVG